VNALTIDDLWAIERRIYDDVRSVFPDFALTFQSFESWNGYQPGPRNYFVCHLRGWSFVVPADQGVEQACAMIADKVQDMIVEDVVGGMWPPGEPMLQATFDPASGEAGWQSDVRSVRIGELGDS
jgi:hypothetical protein